MAVTKGTLGPWRAQWRTKLQPEGAITPLAHSQLCPLCAPHSLTDTYRVFPFSFALDNVQLGAPATLAWPPVDTFEGGADGWVGSGIIQTCVVPVMDSLLSVCSMRADGRCRSPFSSFLLIIGCSLSCS